MEERDEQSTPGYIRWIPVLVPLSALVVVSGIYLIAAEVLTRAG